MLKRSKARRISVSAQKYNSNSVNPSSEFKVNVFSAAFTAISALASAAAAFYAGAQSSISAQALSAGDRSAAFSGFYAAHHELCEAAEVRSEKINVDIDTEYDLHDQIEGFRVQYDNNSLLSSSKALEYRLSVTRYFSYLNFRQSLLNVYINEDQRDELSDWRSELTFRLSELLGPDDIFDGKVEYSDFLQPALDFYANCVYFERAFPQWFIEHQQLPPWSTISVSLTTRQK